MHVKAIEDIKGIHSRVEKGDGSRWLFHFTGSNDVVPSFNRDVSYIPIVLNLDMYYVEIPFEASKVYV